MSWGGPPGRPGCRAPSSSRAWEQELGAGRDPQAIPDSTHAQGGGDQKSNHRLRTVTSDPDAPTLAELGISKRESIQCHSLTAYDDSGDTTGSRVGFR